MTRWFVISAVYVAMFLMSSKFDAMQTIAGGLMCGAVSIGALKLFGMDKKEWRVVSRTCQPRRRPTLRSSGLPTANAP